MAKYTIETNGSTADSIDGNLGVVIEVCGRRIWVQTPLSLTPYIKPDIELLADEAHGIGFSEGYEQGIKQGRKEMCEAVIKLADVGKRICAFDGGSIEYIFKTYKPETILGELAHFDKQKFDKDLSTLVEQYGYDGVTEVLRKMIESEKE